MGTLDEALRLQPAADGCWSGRADPDYESANGMFGGWTTALMLLAIAADDDLDAMPTSITTAFVATVEPGTEVLVRTRRLGGSRSVHHWAADLTNGDRLAAAATAVLTTRRDGPGHTEPTMPEVPAPETLDRFRPPNPEGERADIRSVHGHPPFGADDTRSAAWVRDTTGRPVDAAQLAFLADQCAPRTFYWAGEPHLSATLTMSVFFHATADDLAAVGDDYVLHEAIGNRAAASTSGQHVRLWSRSGALLATSEQICWYRLD